MNYYRNKLVIGLVLAIIIQGCSVTYYAPNSHNVPLFQEKNEGRFNFAASISEDMSGTEMQGAYSVSDKIGIMINAIWAVGRQSNSIWGGSSVSNKYRFFEIGGGYFRKLDDNLVFEAYGGGGLGKSENTYSGYNSSSKHNLYRLFMQPGVGLTTKIFDLAVSARLSGLDYYKSSYSGYFGNNVQLDHLKLDESEFMILFEPAVTMRIGFKKVKLQLQYVYSENWSNPEFPMEHVNFNLGVYFLFTNKYSKVEPGEVQSD